MMHWKPDGYTSLSPYVIVDDAASVIRFCTEVFDAVELRRFDRPGGGVMHAELRIDDSVLMLADSTAEWPPSPCMLHLYVPDVDETYRRALAAGAESLQAPVQKGDPDRRAGFRDPGGNGWWVGTQVG